MRQIPVERGHLVFGDGIFEAFERRLLGGFGCGRIGKSEDVLGEREQRILHVLGIGTHLGGFDVDGSRVGEGEFQVKIEWLWCFGVFLSC